MSYIVVSTTGPKGRQTGYAVKLVGEDLPLFFFRTRDYGYWRFAKDAAQRECDKLNREAA